VNRIVLDQGNMTPKKSQQKLLEATPHRHIKNKGVPKRDF